MSGEVVNLRRARKQKVRARADAVATENRARYGMSRAERDGISQREALAARHLDGHQLQRDPAARDDSV